MSFWSTLGVTILALSLALGLFYWCKYLLKKLSPNFKNALKYKIFKFKKNKLIVEAMKELIEDGIKGDEAYKMLLCNNIKPKKAKEMIYIQTLLLKGGEK